MRDLCESLLFDLSLRQNIQNPDRLCIVSVVILSPKPSNYGIGYILSLPQLGLQLDGHFLDHVLLKQQLYCVQIQALLRFSYIRDKYQRSWRFPLVDRLVHFLELLILTLLSYSKNFFSTRTLR